MENVIAVVIWTKWTKELGVYICTHNKSMVSSCLNVPSTHCSRSCHINQYVIDYQIIISIQAPNKDQKQILNYTFRIFVSCEPDGLC